MTAARAPLRRAPGQRPVAKDPRSTAGPRGSMGACRPGRIVSVAVGGMAKQRAVAEGAQAILQDGHIAAGGAGGQPARTVRRPATGGERSDPHAEMEEGVRPQLSVGGQAEIVLDVDDGAAGAGPNSPVMGTGDPFGPWNGFMVTSMRS